MKKTIIILILLIILSSGFIFYKKTKLNTTQKKLTFWSIQLKPVYEKQINQIIKDFEKIHPDIKIVWVDIPIQEAQKRTLASILSSNPPDLVNLNPEFSLILAQRNALEFFKEKDIEQFQQSLVDKLKFENKIYALPFYATSPVTIYNEAVFKNCKINNKIKTYDDLYLISQELNECSKQAVFSANLNENDTLAKILNKYDVYNLKDNIQKKSVTKVYLMFDDMYKKGYLPKDTLNINHREVIEKYMSNQALVIVAGSNFINMIKQNAPDIYSKSAISEQLTGKNKKYDISLMNLIIPKKSNNKDLALEFALLLTNEKNQLELSKLTNVLPANKYALQNEYFNNCSDDLVDKSRCISSKQLSNLVDKDFGTQNKKTINEAINKTLEEILLNKNSSPDLIKERIFNLSLQFSTLMNQN